MFSISHRRSLMSLVAILTLLPCLAATSTAFENLPGSLPAVYRQVLPLVLLILVQVQWHFP